MSKGTYEVNDAENKTQPRDTSFRSVICALLIFLVMCIIFIALITGIKGFSSAPKKDQDNESSEVSGLQSGKDNTNNKTDKMNLHAIPTTTIRTTAATISVSTSVENSNFVGGAREITTAKNNKTSTEDSKAPYYNESSVSVPEVTENSSLHPDHGTTTETGNTRNFDGVSETPSDNYSSVSVPEGKENSSLRLDDGTTTETISTRKFDEVSETPSDNYSSVSVAEGNENSSLRPHDGTTTETISTRKSDEYSSVSVPEVNENSSLHPDDDTTTETISTKKFDEVSETPNDNYSSVSVVEENENSSLRPHDGTTTETISTRKSDEYSSVSVPEVNENSSLHPDDDTTTGTVISTNFNYVLQETTTKSTTTSVSTPESSEITTSAIIPRVTQNDVSPLLGILLTNEPTTDISTSDSYSTNKVNTTAKTTESSEDYEIDFSSPNDSNFPYYNFDTLESNPTTTQEPTERIENIDMNGQQSRNQQGVNESEICPSAECKTVASRMLSLMNHSEHPCDDFYEFACGEMQVDNNNRDTWERLSEQIYLINDTAAPHFKTFRTFYNSCVEHEQTFNYTNRVFQVSNLVKEVGWIVDSAAPPNSVDLTSLFAKLILRQSLPIFDVEVDIDSETSQFILKLVPPKMYSILAESGKWSTLSENQIRCLLAERSALQNPELNLTETYSSYLKCQINQSIYINSVQSAVESLGFFLNSYNKSEQIQELRMAIEFDILDLLRDLSPLNSRISNEYEVRTVEDLQTNYPMIQWKKLFKMITGNAISDSTRINYVPEYIKKIFEQFPNNINSEIIQMNNALIAMYAHNLYQNLVISQARHQREDYCLKLSTKLFQDISNNLYVKAWKKSDVMTYQTLSLYIFSQLKNQLKTEIENEDLWLNQYSKNSILAKLRTMELVVNKQEDLYNNDIYLQSKYQIDFIKDNWPSNAVKMLEKYRAMLYSIQESNFSTDNLWSYFITAYDTTPTSFYSKILTVAPLGAMIQHLTKIPNYITMIQIGLPLAREIGRHFDPKGIRNGMVLIDSSKTYYDYLQLLMNNNTRNTTMLVGHQKISFDFNAKLSINVRIADNTAVRLLFNTYNAQKDSALPWISILYSKPQLFFIAVAQEYCSRTSVAEFMIKLFESEVLPPALRVKNIMTHSEEFSKTFQCSPKPQEIEQVPYKLQFPHLKHLDIQKFYRLLQ